MKKLLFVSALVALFTTGAMAQNQFSGYYFKAIGGLSLSAAKTEQPGINSYEQLNPTSMQPLQVVEEGLYGSYGGGGKAGAAVGYMFNRIIGIEMGINYFRSNSQLRERREIELAGVPGNFLFEQHGYARALALIPSLVLTTGNPARLSPYARFSFVVPVWGDLVIDTDINDAFGIVNSDLAGLTATYNRRDQIDPVKPQVGFEGAMGVNYPVSNTVSLFAEAEFRTLTVDGATRETTRFDVRVGDETIKTLTDFPVGVTQGNFQEKLTHESNVAEFHDGTPNPDFDPNQPADELKPFANINGFGFNFGLKVDF